MAGSTMRTAGAERRARARVRWAAVALLASTALAGCVGPGLEPPARDGDSPAHPVGPGMSGSNAGGGSGGRSGSGGLTAGGSPGMVPASGGMSGANPPASRPDGGAPVDMTDEDAGTR